MDDLAFIKAQLTRQRSDQARRRLRTIEGQVRGLEKMIQENRPPVDILTQMTAVQEALAQVGKLVMRNFLESCVSTAAESDSAEEQAIVYDDLMDTIYKFRH
jgi:DNA-binding FrmR family transcriptional regulator